jgi:hypothetical protein
MGRPRGGLFFVVASLEVCCVCDGDFAVLLCIANFHLTVSPNLVNQEQKRGYLAKTF